MLERVQMRTLPMVNRAADMAPIAPACCNVCRTCTTTNAIGIATAAVVGSAAALTRLARRLRPS